jgi:transcriptional regulator with XRE-family HTH domain
MVTLIDGQELRTILGKGIRFYRHQRQLSQAALAEKSNISITFLSNIERGTKYPTSDTLSAIANSLDVEVFELFRHDHSPAKNRTLFERFKIDIKKSMIETLDTVYKAYDTPKR